jgi:hypothetical protein
MAPEAAKRLTEGDRLTHRRRGGCRYVEPDRQDPSGETVWVDFGDDDIQMVSVSQLTRPE